MMFTGIIEEEGIVLSFISSGTQSAVKIQCTTVLDGLHTGDSVAVSGICLTVTSLSADWFTADVMPETVRRTSLYLLHAGSIVNLERAVRADGRFGGHIVTGHIDGTGTIQSVIPEGNAVVYTVRTTPHIIRGIVEKGSVAVDGISLTVVSVSDVPDSSGSFGTFSVSVIPHTREHTSLTCRLRGSTVNIECDILGKYAARYAALQNIKSGEYICQKSTEQDLLQ